MVSVSPAFTRPETSPTVALVTTGVRAAVYANVQEAGFAQAARARDVRDQQVYLSGSDEGRSGQETSCKVEGWVAVSLSLSAAESPVLIGAWRRVRQMICSGMPAG